MLSKNSHSGNFNSSQSKKFHVSVKVEMKNDSLNLLFFIEHREWGREMEMKENCVRGNV